MTPRRRTLYGTLAAAAALAAWDVYLLLDADPDNTISSVLGDQGWALAGIGFVAGHLVSRAPPDVPRWASAASGVVMVGVGAVIESPILALVAGLVGGFMMWPSASKGGP